MNIDEMKDRIARAEEIQRYTENRCSELETRCNELFLQTCEQAEKIKELNAEIENDRDLPAIAYMQGAEKQKKKDEEQIRALEKENTELRKVAEFQQSSNMSRHFENKKLKEGLAVGSTFNKALNSMNKTLEEERDKYRNMVFDKDEELQKWKDEWQEQVQKATDEGYARTLQTMQLTKAKEIIREFVEWANWQGNSKCPSFKSIQDKAEAFLNSEVEK